MDAQPNDASIVERFKTFIQARDFPCVGAKSALSREQMTFVVARDIRSAWDDLVIYQTLLEFTDHYRLDNSLFQSVVVLFEEQADLDEEAFERALWERVQSLSDKDAWHGQDYDPRVSKDAEDPHFSLSFGGEAFFVVGLHPRASRPARRFETPALVFNLHDQFERLREEQKYEKLRGAILQRDEVLAGSQNPMLARHGEVSEARQYSGRAVGDGWKCPFSDKKKVDQFAL